VVLEVIVLLFFGAAIFSGPLTRPIAGLAMGYPLFHDSPPFGKRLYQHLCVTAIDLR
jgi:hypothetical protein